MNVLLISTYELGRQPFGLASPAAWLARAGASVTCADLSRQRLNDEHVRRADLIAFYLPMHTATRLAVGAIARVRDLNARAHLCCYGLYAPLNARLLRSLGVHTILGAEFEEDLAALATRGLSPDAAVLTSSLPRLRFLTPDRSALPPLSDYASVQVAGRRRTSGYTEASRGCKHWCRHCPVVPVYQGRFRIVQREVVLADIRNQVARGAEHVTFGDPDFFNGVGHALAVVEAVAREFAGLTYDVTIKVEHLLQHARHLPRLRDTGCLFITTAVESIDDRVLALLEKGHTQSDFIRAVGLCRQHGLALAPTFVPFTPWTTLEGYCQLLEAIDELDLVEQVAPIQLAIRLLVPEGSRLLELAGFRESLGPFDPATLTFPWRHEDPRVDALQRDVMALVGSRINQDREEVFRSIWTVAHERTGVDRRPGRAVSQSRSQARDRATVPYLTEPWFC